MFELQTMCGQIKQSLPVHAYLSISAKVILSSQDQILSKLVRIQSFWANTLINNILLLFENVFLAKIGFYFKPNLNFVPR